jgi:hypothetical protein
MSVGRVKGGRAGGAGKAGAPAKAGGAGFAGKVGRNEAVEKASGLVGAAAGGVAAADPVTVQALDIARQLKAGTIKTKEEATRKLVADILREKVRLQSKALTQKIADQLKDDPRLSQALERLWSKAE